MTTYCCPPSPSTPIPIRRPSDSPRNVGRARARREGVSELAAAAAALAPPPGAAVVVLAASGGLDDHDTAASLWLSCRHAAVSASPPLPSRYSSCRHRARRLWWASFGAVGAVSAPLIRLRERVDGPRRRQRPYDVLANGRPTVDRQAPGAAPRAPARTHRVKIRALDVGGSVASV